MSGSDDPTEPAVYMGRWITQRVLRVMEIGMDQCADDMMKVLKGCLNALASNPQFWGKLSIFKGYLRSLVVVGLEVVGTAAGGGRGGRGRSGRREEVEQIKGKSGDGRVFEVMMEGGVSDRIILACLIIIQSLLNAEAESSSDSIVLTRSETLKLISHIDSLWQQMNILIIEWNKEWKKQTEEIDMLSEELLKKEKENRPRILFLERLSMQYLKLCTKGIILYNHKKFVSNFTIAGQRLMLNLPRGLELIRDSELDICSAEFIFALFLSGIPYDLFMSVLQIFSSSFIHYFHDGENPTNLFKAGRFIEFRVEGDDDYPVDYVDKFSKFSNTQLQNLANQLLNLPLVIASKESLFEQKSSSFTLTPEISTQRKFDIAFSNCNPLKTLNLSTEEKSIQDITSFITSNSFLSLSTSDKLEIIRHIGKLGCILSESYIPTIGKCRTCDRQNSVLDIDRQTYEGFYELFLALIHSDHFQQEPNLRLETLLSMKRVYSSFSPDFNFDNKSDLGIWLIACFRSTSREIRIACTRLLPCFITLPEPQANIQADNIFKFLSSINFEVDSYLFETTIMAWGQIARFSQGERLNFILMRLIEYLGSTNAFHSSVAYHELNGIAKSNNLTCWQLCTPFWSTISVMIVKKMVENRSLLSRFAELLHISVNDFLHRTTSFTVPYLVLAKKYDAIELIAKACSATTKKIYLDHVPVILAVLLTQDVSRPELFAEQRWLDADPSFNIVEFADVIGPNVQGLSFELLKLAPGIGSQGVSGKLSSSTSTKAKPLKDIPNQISHLNDYDDNQKASRIRYALEYLGAMKFNCPSGPDSLASLFNEGHVLQLVAQFSDTVRNLSGKKSYTIKLQCLRGISMMMRCSGDSLSSAIPQICAFLQSALDARELQQAAIQAWHIMIDQVEDLGSILDLTFCVVVQKWPDLLASARKEAKRMIEHIVVNRLSQISDIVSSKGAPSLESIPELQEYNVSIRKLYPAVEGVSHFYRFINQLLQRSYNENKYVVRQTVQELRELLLDYQDEVQISLNREKLLEHIKNAVRSLLNLIFTFRSSNTDIPVLCSQCLGLIGAIDRHKVDISPEHEDLLILHNFDEARESIDFVSRMIEEFLIRSFKASTDPSVQMFLAYGIQEYLKFCNLNEATLKSSKTPEVWRKFSSESRPYLIPLLSTRYSAPSPPPPIEKRPIFNPTISYSRWLQAFTYSLMSKAQGANAEKIFTVCRKMVRDRDHFQSLFDYVLPYVALNVAIGGTVDDRNAMLQEIFTILNTPSQSFDDIGQFHKRIFTIVDYFNKWMRAMKKYKSSDRHRRSGATQHSDSVAIIDDFLKQLTPDLMAQRSYDCKSFPRAIMYWEQHLKEAGSRMPSDNVQAIYSKFQEIYANIDDPDAFDGVTTMIPTLGLDKQILQYETTGRWHEALECYEVLMENDNNTEATTVSQWDLKTELKMMNCLKESGRYDDLLARLDRSVSGISSVSEELISLGIEVSWLSGKWASLEKWLSCTTNDTYESNVGNALLALRDKRADELQHRIGRAREKLANDLSSSYVTSLGQCAEAFVRLHALADLESIGSLACATTRLDDLKHEDVSTRLDKRLAVVGPDFDSRRYLLALRRSAISVSGLVFASQEVAMTWVSSAHDARKQDQPTLALRATIQALVHDNPLAKVEHAKLLWKQGEQRKAVTTLESIIDPLFLTDIKRFSQKVDVSKSEAKAALLYTKWIDYSDQADSDTILTKYQAVTFVSPKWEKAYYHLARYYNKIFDYQTTLPEELRTDAYLDGSLVGLMVKAYCRSLQYGVKYVYETMPKLITIWLDFATIYNKFTVGNFRNGKQILTARLETAEVNNTNVRKLLTKIPAYMFYLALPQLLSRINHNDPKVCDTLEMIIVGIAKDYPQQALWSILAVVNSKQEKRQERGKRIINRLRISAKNATGAPTIVRELLNPAMKLVSVFIDFCNTAPPRNKAICSLSSDLDFDASCLPCKLVVPVRQLMDISLPSTPNEIKHHSPFQETVYIYGIHDAVHIQSSLQRPKRITVYASNGLPYKILCKPHDDVRKDARLMEFTTTIDKLLMKDNEASLRRLRISRYRVTPLNEDCGLIEWVDNAVPIRSIIANNYSTKGVEIQYTEAKELLMSTGETEQQRIRNFKKLLEKYFPVFGEWFIDTFPEPSVWMTSRTNYSRSSAVMSMVGYILGLGDRHGENILMLGNTGGVLHVDFDCLFDKGLELELPECVPFRLTNQMVDAFGVSGYEGAFRRSSEVTLNLLRNHESMLMTIMETFLHDPIVEWSGHKKKKVPPPRVINGLMAARTPEQALTSIRNKIRGKRATESIPLSVSGQVEYLIQQATSPLNLAKMFHGWAPYL